MGLFLFLYCCRTFVSLACNNNTPETCQLLNLYYFQNLQVSPEIFHFFKTVICISLILVSLDIIYLGCTLFSATNSLQKHMWVFYSITSFCISNNFLISNEEVKGIQLRVHAKIKFLQRIKYWGFCTLMHSFKCFFWKKNKTFTLY